MWTVRVFGTPAPKGNLRCYGQGGRHILTEVLTDQSKGWRQLITHAGKQIRVAAGETLTGPISVEATFTLRRPKSVSVEQRPWPIVKPDNDKLQRMLLDGLTGSKVWGDDAQAVEITARKTYPDTPGCPDRLEKPGAIIRIWKTTDV